jgi:hypothetical protein
MPTTLVIGGNGEMFAGRRRRRMGFAQDAGDIKTAGAGEPGDKLKGGRRGCRAEERLKGAR